MFYNLYNLLLINLIYYGFELLINLLCSFFFFLALRSDESFFCKVFETIGVSLIGRIIIILQKKWVQPYWPHPLVCIEYLRSDYFHMSPHELLFERNSPSNSPLPGRIDEFDPPLVLKFEPLRISPAASISTTLRAGVIYDFFIIVFVFMRCCDYLFY